MNIELHISNLEDLEIEAGEISGGWNGKDPSFIVDGDVYSEEDAHVAYDIVELTHKIRALLQDL